MSAHRLCVSLYTGARPIGTLSATTWPETYIDIIVFVKKRMVDNVLSLSYDIEYGKG